MNECKSNLKYKSNLYVLKKEHRYEDSEFFAKITDPDMLRFYKYGRRLPDSFFSKIQLQIIGENSLCSTKLEHPDPCWGKKGNEYICKCVNIDCKDLNKCRKNVPLEENEYENFAPEKYIPVEYEYNGVEKDVYYYPIRTTYANEDNYQIPEKILNEIIEQTIETDINSTIWEDSPELIYVQEKSEKEISERNYDDEYEYEDEVSNEIFEQKTGEFRIVKQNGIIEENAKESFLVNAGPGTGKTYTLIHKINHLIKSGEDEDSDEDIDSSNIYVLSFTNAAVKEIYDRLIKAKEMYGIQNSVRSVNLRTFDSFIYYIINRAKDEYTDIYIDTKFDSYIKSRENAIKILEKHPEILKKFEMKYFIVDEIQDLTNSLAQFVLAVLKACRKQNIPFSLFGDTCQSIYDFNKENILKMTTSEFYNEVKSLFKDKNNFVELIGNRRQSKYLTELTSDYRQLILNEEIEELKKELKYIGSDIPKINFNDMRNYDSTHSPSIAFLTRNNGQALDYASKLKRLNIQFMINPSSKNEKNGFIYAPWIAQVFYGYKQEKMYFDDFGNIIKNKQINLPELNYKEDGKNKNELFWEYLTKSSNELIVKDFLNDLYTNKVNNQVTKFVQKKEIIEVSTIHKAKGREFDKVFIDENFYYDVTGISKHPQKPEEKIEEHRTMYVALTRPKSSVSLIEYNIEEMNKPKKEYLDNFNIWYKGPKRNPDAVSILDDCIDFDQFYDDAEYIRQKISYGAEIRLTGGVKDNRYHIECNVDNKFIEIGLMEIKFNKIIWNKLFVDGEKLKSMKKFNMYGVNSSRQKNKLHTIKNLYVDKIFTYLKKDSNGIITPITGVTFTGFGKFIK